MKQRKKLANILDEETVCKDLLHTVSNGKKF